MLLILLNKVRSSYLMSSQRSKRQRFIGFVIYQQNLRVEDEIISIREGLGDKLLEVGYLKII